MNEQSLFERFDKSPLLNNLVDRIAMSTSLEKPFQVFLQNLNGSSAAFVLQSIFGNAKTNHFNHLVVLNDAEEAAYFFNSIESVTEALDLFYFRFLNRFKIINMTFFFMRI